MAKLSEVTMNNQYRNYVFCSFSTTAKKKKKKKGKVVAKLLVWLKSITFFEETKKILSDELALLLLT